MHLTSRFTFLLLIGGLGLAADTCAQEREKEQGARHARERQSEESEEIRTVRQRLRVMRYAVDAFVEAKRPNAAEQVELAMHARELAIKGIRNEKSADIAKVAPSRGQLAELLGAASNLYENLGKTERSQALAQLAEVYANQSRRQQRAKAEGRSSERERVRETERETAGDGGIRDLNRRIEILRLARGAFDRAGKKDRAQRIGRFLRVAEMQREGMGAEALGEAFKGLSMGIVVELLQHAAEIYTDWGSKEQAAACNQLATYYAPQVRGQQGQREVEQQRDSGPEPERKRREAAEQQAARARGGLENVAQRMTILRLVRAAHVEAGDRLAAGLMGRILHLGELQLEGAEGEALVKASRGITQGSIIELVRAAEKLYREGRNQERSAACRRLADFYRKRAEAQEAGTKRDPVREGIERREREEVLSGQRSRADSDGDAVIQELREQIARLQDELSELKATLRKLADK